MHPTSFGRSRARVLAASVVLALPALCALPATAVEGTPTGAVATTAATAGSVPTQHTATDPAPPGPTPVVSIPPAGERGFPMMASGRDLAAIGYVEEEFFLTGTAQVYEPAAPWGDDGRWDSRPVEGSATPYSVRILVRRPADPAQFNGTVFAEWANVSGGFEISPGWYLAGEEITRTGAAHVHVSAQYNGLENESYVVADALIGARSWDPVRYADLHHPGDSFAYDIFSQAGRAMRSPASGGPRPLGDLTAHISQVLALGESQSGAALFTYVNAVHPTAGVYDGFLVHSAGFGFPLTMPLAAIVPPNPLPPGYPEHPFATPPSGAASRIRTDLDEPVMVLQTETDVPFAAVGVHTQPDSDTFRLWEVAGTSHGDADLLATGIVDGRPSKPDFAGFDCRGPQDPIAPINDGPQAPAVRAALRHLARWAAGGPPPPVADRLVLAPDGSVERDPVTRLAIGGLRLPDVTVPTRTLLGERILPGNVLCILFGQTDPWNGNTDPWDGWWFDPAPVEPDLAELYPTHFHYVWQVALATASSVAAGYLLVEDALPMLGEALTAPVPG